VSADFLSTAKVAEWSDMPVWVPRTDGASGFLRQDIGKALAAGLTFRPLEQTAADTLEWFRQQPAERQAQLKSGLTPQREQQVLAAWHRRLGPEH
jgi:2'-hydroxyisoflavone reductase